MEGVLKALLRLYFQKIEDSILKDLMAFYKRPGDLLNELGFIFEQVFLAPKSTLSVTFDCPCLYIRLTNKYYLAYHGKISIENIETISKHSVFYEILGMKDILYTATKRLYCFSKIDYLILLPLTITLFLDIRLALCYLGILLMIYKIKYHIHKYKTKDIFNAFLLERYNLFLNKHVSCFAWNVLLYILFSFSMHKHGWLSLLIPLLFPFRSNRWIFIFGLILSIDVPLVGITIALCQYPYKSIALPSTLAYRFLFKNQHIDTFTVDGIALKEGVYILKNKVKTLEINDFLNIQPDLIRYYEDVYVVDEYRLDASYFDASSLQNYLCEIQQEPLICYFLHLDACQDEVLEMMMFYELSRHQQRYIYLNRPVCFLDETTLFRIIEYLKKTQHTFILYLPQHYFVENLSNCVIIGGEMR